MQKLLSDIEQFMKRNNMEYFSYAWHENIVNMLDNESKYNKLIDWIDKQLYDYSDQINIFNPADKTLQYTNENFKTFQNACTNIAMLLNFKTTLLDDKCTTEMRENLEYTICKLYKIQYNKNLNEYL